MALAYYIVSPGHLQLIIAFKQTLQEAGAVELFKGNWLQWEWPSEWHNASIMAIELVLIALSCAVWGPKLSRTRVLFQCDNLGLVAAISKGS